MRRGGVIVAVACFAVVGCAGTRHHAVAHAEPPAATSVASRAGPSLKARGANWRSFSMPEKLHLAAVWLEANQPNLERLGPADTPSRLVGTVNRFIVNPSMYEQRSLAMLAGAGRPTTFRSSTASPLSEIFSDVDNVIGIEGELQAYTARS